VPRVDDLPTSQIMVPEQSRSARAWLGWSQDDLAKRANVSVNTVRNFERGQKPLHSNSVAAMRQALEIGGIKLLFDSRGVAAGIIRKDADFETSPDNRA
jgi:ribosome-binding protein aMBF1 (putative translation factor)